MFREYLEKGKIWVEKIASAVMNYTELENKVREATSDEPWGPHGKILNDLARESHDPEGLIEIMSMLLNRVFPENPTNWRRIYKGLSVLAHLLRYGSDRVCEIAQDNIYNIRSLENYQCFDERGRDQGSSVRAKAHEVAELIQNPELLESERQKALSNQKMYDGIGNSHVWGSNYSGSYGIPDGTSSNDWDSEDSYRFPARAVPKAEMPWQTSGSGSGRKECGDAPSPSRPQSPNTLGSFDDWKGAHERTLADDVADKLSEVLRAAKVVTNDMLGRPRVPPPSIYEEDPHKVSEETFSFPDATIDQPEDLEEQEQTYRSYRQQSAFSGSSTSGRFGQQQPVETPELAAPAPALIDLGAPPTSNVVVKTSGRLPRPPSTEALVSSPKNTNEIDFFAELDNRRPKLPARHNSSNSTATTTDLFANFNPANLVPPTVKIMSASSTANGNGNLLGDEEFNDFSSFNTAPVKPADSANAAASQPATQLADLFFDVFSTPQPPLPPPPINASQTQQPSQASSAAEPKSTVVAVGKTWSDLGAFNLNIDFKASPSASQKPAAPSLSQLQQLKQPPPVAQPLQAQKTTPGASAAVNSLADEFSNFAMFK